MRKSLLCPRSLARDTSPLVLVKKSILVSWERTPLGSEGLGWTWTASGRRIQKVTRNAGPVSNPITSFATAFVHKRPSECWAIFGLLEWRYPSISCGGGRWDAFIKRAQPSTIDIWISSLEESKYRSAFWWRSFGDFPLHISKSNEFLALGL